MAWNADWPLAAGDRIKAVHMNDLIEAVNERGLTVEAVDAAFYTPLPLATVGDRVEAGFINGGDFNSVRVKALEIDTFFGDPTTDTITIPSITPPPAVISGDRITAAAMNALRTEIQKLQYARAIQSSPLLLPGGHRYTRIFGQAFAADWPTARDAAFANMLADTWLDNAGQDNFAGMTANRGGSPGNVGATYEEYRTWWEHASRSDNSTSLTIAEIWFSTWQATLAALDIASIDTAYHSTAAWPASGAGLAVFGSLVATSTSSTARRIFYEWTASKAGFKIDTSTNRFIFRGEQKAWELGSNGFNQMQRGEDFYLFIKGAYDKP